MENEQPLDFSAAAKSMMLKPADEKSAALDFGGAAKELAQGRAATALKLSEGTNPDQAARALDLSKRSGLPLPAVEGSEDAVAAQLRTATVSAALDKAPVTRLWFAEPTNAKIAHDDAENLTALEHVWNGGRALASGAVDMPGMTLRGWGAARHVFDRRVTEATIAGLHAVGADGVVDLLNSMAIPGSLDRPNILSRAGREIGDMAEAIGPDKKDQNFATDVMQGVGQVAAQITAAILTGGVSSAVSMSTMLGMGASQQEDMVKEAGATGTAGGDTAILVGAGVAALTEKYGLDMLLNKIPAATKNRVMRMLAGAASEGTQEVVEGVLQNLTAVALYDPENPLFDGVAYQGGVGAAVGGIVSALVPGRHARQAQADKRQMDEAGKIADQSALARRSPEKFGEFHGALLRDQGHDKIAIPADKLQEFMQDGAEDPAEFMRNLGVTDQMDEALARGGDVELTPEAYSQYVLADKDVRAKLGDHIRMDSEGMTQAESEEWLKTGAKDALKQAAEEMARQNPDAESDTAQIQAEVEQQLKAIGEAPDAATHAAVLTAQRYATRAERAGETPLALWRADNLQVMRDNGQRAPVTDLDLTLDKARSTDPAALTGDVQWLNDTIDAYNAETGGNLSVATSAPEEIKAAVAAMEAKGFEQPARGSIQFGADATIMRLGANADRSTFLHESGHLYLEQLRADAKTYSARNPQLEDDLNTVTDWWAKNAASLKAEAIGYAKKAKDKAAVAVLENMTDAAVARAIRMGPNDGGSFEQGAVDSNAIIAEVNAAIDRHNYSAAKRGYDGEPMPRITSLDEIDGHESVPARTVALEEIAKGQGWRVGQGRGSVTTASEYLDLSRPSGVTDSDGFPVDLELRVRISDHPNTAGGEPPHINFAPGADGINDVIKKLTTARFGDSAGASDGDNLDILFQEGDAASGSARSDGEPSRQEPLTKGGGGIKPPGTGGVNTYIQRAMHEQWARGTEDYFRTGQAPSVALQDAFNRFKAWLVSIYSAMKRRNLDVQFSPEVKAVMDRMLATDEEIALVQAQYNLKALFSSAEEIGMTPKRFAAYQADVARSVADAKTAQLKKHLNQVERTKLEWWKEERAKMRATVAPEIEARQVYAAMFALARGTTPAGDPLPLKVGRLDRAATVAILENKASLARLPRLAGRAVYAAAKVKGGADPDIVADFYGYEDGRTMLFAMMNAPPIAAAIDAETDARMKAEFGDMTIDGTAIDAALEATHNDKRGDALAAELNMLIESGPKMKTAFVRQWAKERIGTRKVDNIQPGKFLAAEKRYGREAGMLLRKGDRVGAQRAKFQQLLNFYMAKESYAVRVEVDKAKTYLAKFESKTRIFKNTDADYIDQIRGILEAYNLMPRLSDAKRERLMDFAKREAEENGALLNIPPEIAANDGKTHFRDLTLDEFRTLTDTIKNIEAQGRNVKDIKVDGKYRAIDAVAADLESRWGEVKARVVREDDHKVAFYDPAANLLHSFDASMKKVEFIIEQIDGERLGPLHRALFQPMADAEHAKNDLNLQVSKVVLDALAKIDGSRIGKKFHVPMMGVDLTVGEIIMIGLNTGNDSNYDKMIRGSDPKHDRRMGARKWTDESVDEAISNLEKDEIEVIFTIWDALASMYPQVEAAHRRENGTAPPKIELRPVISRFGQVHAGGYFPMLYDHKASLQGKKIADLSIDEVRSLAAASVNSSMTKARNEGFAAPISLDISLIARHIEKTAHYITHDEAFRDAKKLLNNRLIADGIRNRVGPEYEDALNKWVNDIATNGRDVVAADPAIMKSVEFVRSNTVVAIMGFSYTTGVTQTLGVFNAIDALSKSDKNGGAYSARKGGLQFLKGLKLYLSDTKGATEQVRALSGEMRHRIENTDREISRQLKLLSGKKGHWATMKRASLRSIALMQFYMVDMPTWLAANDKALKQGRGQDDAVKYADNILRTSQSAGATKDLASIQRERGIMQLFTMFYSYLNLLYNVQAQILGDIKKGGYKPKAFGAAAERAALILVLPTIVEAVMRNEWPDDDEDYPTWLALKIFFNSVGSVAFVRDLAGIGQGFGYSPTPAAGLGNSLGRAIPAAWRAIEDGEMDAKALKSLVSLLGYGAGLPSTQINRIIGAADAMLDGEDVSPYDFLVGHKKEK